MCKSSESLHRSYNLFQTVLTSVSHERKGSKFVTGGDVCQIWDETRTQPIKNMEWGVDTVHHVTFNPIETFLVGANPCLLRDSWTEINDRVRNSMLLFIFFSMKSTCRI